MRGWLAVVLVGAFLGAAGSAAAFAPAAEAPRLFPESWPDIEAPTPHVLSARDSDLYQRIFDLQERGRWNVADRLIRRLSDPVLLGHVLHQRYMHPTAYRSAYKELAAWLDAYADVPGAREIARLAALRRPKGAPAPAAAIAAPSAIGFADEEAELPYRRLSPDRLASREGRVAARSIEALLQKGRRADALAHLAEAAREHELPTGDYDQIRARIAASFYLTQQNVDALTLAAASADRSRAIAPAADWVAGLAAWRLRNYDMAARHFEALSRSETAIAWSRSAGAFWAARAHLVAKRPDKVNPLLETAAAEPRTFYGILANRLLGRQAELLWETPPLAPAEMADLLAMPSIRRAVALKEAGETERADLELRQAYLFGGGEVAPALLGLANRLGMPVSQLRLAHASPSSGGRVFATALYPLPPWEPEGGFTVDRALLFAFMRQESGFNAKARSSAGARGLMQLMPATASYVAGDDSLRHASRHKLLLPEYNMALGQKYLAYLLDNEDVRGNLVYLAVAYNAGPGNLRKWRQQSAAQDDPLLFIESLPSHETRNLVVRVLTNYWVYRLRFGQAAPSLEALAAGEWPPYVALEQDQRAFRHARK